MKTRLIGTLTFAVAAIWFPWCAAIFWLIKSPEGKDLMQSRALFDGVLWGTAAILLTVFGLLAYYLRYLARTPRIAPDKKAFWRTVLVLAHVIAMPIFFYRHVRHDDAM